MKVLINQLFCLHHAELLVKLNQHCSFPLIVLPKFRGILNQWKDQNSSPTVCLSQGDIFSLLTDPFTFPPDVGALQP